MRELHCKDSIFASVHIVSEKLHLDHSFDSFLTDSPPSLADLAQVARNPVFDKVDVLLRERNSATIVDNGVPFPLSGWTNLCRLKDVQVYRWAGGPVAGKESICLMDVPEPEEEFPPDLCIIKEIPKYVRITSTALCLDHVFVPGRSKGVLRQVMSLAGWSCFDKVIFSFQDRGQGIFVKCDYYENGWAPFGYGVDIGRIKGYLPQCTVRRRHA